LAKPRFPVPGHDHKACVEHSLERAHAAFGARGARLTKLREAVLRVLAESHEALGAYEIIDRLRSRGRKIAPISVYRILDALLEAGLVHRIESRNAFVACHGSHGEKDAPILFLVCDKCGTVAEAPGGEIAESLRSSAGAAGFETRDSVLEATGVCRHCAD
jgi:Fur family transcriptional regulator, zinc uptake regulator